MSSDYFSESNSEMEGDEDEPEWLKFVVVIDENKDNEEDDAQAKDTTPLETSNVEGERASEPVYADSGTTHDASSSHQPCEQNEEQIWTLDSNMKDVKLHLKSRFMNADVFRLVFKTYAVEQGFDYDFYRNESTRVGCICKKGKCNFFIWCSKMSGTTDMEIIEFNPKHTCGRAVRNDKITSDFIAKRYLDYIRESSKIDVFKFQRKIYEDLIVRVSKHRVYRAIRKARALCVGDLEKQYARLHDYCEIIMRTNPNSKCKVQVENTAMSYDENPLPRFLRMYVRYEPQLTGFIDGCRPLVGIDGCHLKGHYGGQLLSAVGWDANDGIFPLAFAIVEQENKEAWRWFLTEFFDDFGGADERRWVFISDKQMMDQ